jgi:hypothetical protein
MRIWKMPMTEGHHRNRECRNPNRNDDKQK